VVFLKTNIGVFKIIIHIIFALVMIFLDYLVTTGKPFF